MGAPASVLSDIRVLDLTQFLAGATCTMLLGDFGADVVKVERPDGGDAYRRAGPPFVGDDSVPFLTANRNKRSLAVDLSHPAGAEVRERLLDWCDVAVVSLRPAAARRLGIGPDQATASRPALVYCSVSGFGLDGPLADAGSVDMITQANSGLMSVTGTAVGEPLRMGVPITDYGTGMFAALAIVAALRERERNGSGAVLDANLFGTAAWWGAIPLLHYQVTGATQPRTGNIHPHIAPYQLVATADGYVAVSAPNEPSWGRLCQAIGAPDLADDPRFSSNPQRRAHVDELNAALEEHFRRATTREWVTTLSSHDVACGPVHSHADVLADPEYRWHLQLLEYPDHGRDVALPALPVRWNGTVAPARRPAPALGADNDEVLSDLGFQDADVRRLRGEGVV